MVRFAGCFALGCLAAGGQVRVEFRLVDRPVIEQRLRLDSSNNQQRLEALRALFEQAGCRAERLEEQPVKGSSTPNLVCTLPGRSESLIIVGGHFDAEFVGKGIVDNWSGASLLPSLYQALSQHPRRHTLIFIGFTGEEQGLIGSQSYVRRFKKDDVHRIRAMVNLDTLGLAPTSMWVSHSDKELVRLMASVEQSLKLPLLGTNVERVGTTDSETFRERKVPAITLHSVTQETWPILHSKKDTYEAIRLDDYYDSYRLITAYLALLDLKLDADHPPPGTSAR